MEETKSKCYDCINCRINFEHTTSGSYRAILSCKKNHIIPVGGKIISCIDHKKKEYSPLSNCYFSPNLYEETEEVYCYEI